MTYCPWNELAASPDLTLIQTTPLRGGHLGVYDHSARTISLDSRMIERQARSVLAHELRHAAHGDIGYGVVANEARADAEAARLLIPSIRRLRRSLERSQGDLVSVARTLDVSDYILGVRLSQMRLTTRLKLGAGVARCNYAPAL